MLSVTSEVLFEKYHYCFLNDLCQKQKERRHEVKMRRKLELKEINENATLLMDMLGQIEIEQRDNTAESVSEDTLGTLKFLYDSCMKLQPTIMILLNDTDDNDCLGICVFFSTLLILLKHNCK